MRSLYIKYCIVAGVVSVLMGIAIGSAFAKKDPTGVLYNTKILRVTDGDIILNGQSLRANLIQNGFAREYYGDEKQSWCQ